MDRIDNFLAELGEDGKRYLKKQFVPNIIKCTKNHSDYYHFESKRHCGIAKIYEDKYTNKNDININTITTTLQSCQNCNNYECDMHICNNCDGKLCEECRPYIHCYDCLEDTCTTTYCECCDDNTVCLKCKICACGN